MILEFGIPESAASTLTPLLPSGQRFRRVGGFAHLDLLLPRANGLLLGVPHAAHPALIADLRGIRRRYPWLPLVVAGPDVRTGLHTVQRVEVLQAGADRVIAYAQPFVESHEDYQRLWHHQPLRRLAATVQHAAHLPASVRALMVRALLRERPIDSVAELASLIRRHRASLWKLLTRAERPVPTAGQFVDWVQLLQVAVRKDSQGTWKAAAEAVGARPSSVARTGKRLLGVSLSGLDEQVRRTVFSAFLRDMVGFTPREIRQHAPIAPPLLLGASRDALAGDSSIQGARGGGANGASSAPFSSRQKADFTIGRTWILSPPAVTETRA